MCEETFKCSYMLCLPLYGKHRTKLKSNQICPSLRLLYSRNYQKIFRLNLILIRIAAVVGLKFWFPSFQQKLFFKWKINMLQKWKTFVYTFLEWNKIWTPRLYWDHRNNSYRMVPNIFLSCSHTPHSNVHTEGILKISSDITFYFFNKCNKIKESCEFSMKPNNFL